MNFPPAHRDARSAPFFDALATGVLLLRRCRPHGHLSAPEVTACVECGHTDLDWAPAAGTGHVVTWTAVHSRPDPTGVSTVEVVLAVVELTEGPWLRTRLLADQPADPRSGAPVVLDIIAGPGEPIYAFRLAPPSKGSS